MTPTGTAGRIRASDIERDEVAALLAQQVAAGRLTMSEFEERVDAAYVARTRGQLQDLTVDLPGEGAADEITATAFDPCLLCFLLFVFPPAALVYWLVRRRARTSCEQASDGWAVPLLSAVTPRYARVGVLSHE
jgi:hypothetical protein